MKLFPQVRQFLFVNIYTFSNNSPLNYRPRLLACACANSSTRLLLATSTPSLSTSLTLKPKPCNYLIKARKASGIPGVGNGSPSTMALYTLLRPIISSDFIVIISCNVCAAPYASRAQTSISPKR